MSSRVETREKLLELARLHDEALWHALEQDGHHKSAEGQITLHLTNAFERDEGGDPLRITGVEVYAYVLGPNRTHHFDSVDEALAAVREWHDAEMNHDYGEAA